MAARLPERPAPHAATARRGLLRYAREVMAAAPRARSRAARAQGAALGALLALSAPHASRAADPPRSKPAPTAAAATDPKEKTEPPREKADPAKEKAERQARAVELHDEAKSLYERGQYRRAIAKLEAALELDPDGTELVYNLALIHEKLAEPDVAEGYYRRYVDMETDPRARERAIATLKRLEGAKKSVPEDLQERAPAPSSSAPPAPSSSAPPPPPVRRTPSPMVFVLGGVAVAAASIGVGFGVSALSTHPDGLSTGPHTTSYDLEARASSARTQALVADLAFVTSVVLGAATAVLYLLETRPTPAPAPAAAARAGFGAPF